MPKKKAKVEVPEWNMITWIVPSFANPDGLEQVLNMLELDVAPASAIVILETGDLNLLVYQNLLKKQVEQGKKIGAVYSRGGNLCGAVNHITSICTTSYSFCVISDNALPQSGTTKLYEAIALWLKKYVRRPDDAVIGLFASDNEHRFELFPVVSIGAVGRLGYMFHPVCMYRSLAERWLIDTAKMADKLTLIPGVKMVSNGFVDDHPTAEYNECRLVYERHLPGIRRIDAQRIAERR